MFTITIQSSVGRGGVNRVEDVATVQELVNLIAAVAADRLELDGSIGDKTIAAIEGFQRDVVKAPEPDGRVDPGGATFAALLRAAGPSLFRLTTLPAATGTRGIADGDYDRVAKDLGCEAAAIKAVSEVEAGGDGFFSSGRPKILFEAHIFSRETGRTYDRLHPGISSPVWNKALYAGGEAEYNRLLRAMVLNRDAALKSASWGRFQIMGFNHAAAGRTSIASFVDAMFLSEAAQFDAFVAFLKSTGLDDPLKKKDWARFAKGYNGAAYAENEYDKKIERAYNKYKPPPRK